MLRGAQALGHGVVMLLGWAGFIAVGWRIALRPWDGTVLSVLVMGLALALPALALIWVVHNIDLHRRKGPRTHLVTHSANPASDVNGCEVKADWAALQGVRIVVIEVVGGVKQYRVAGQ